MDGEPEISIEKARGMGLNLMNMAVLPLWELNREMAEMLKKHQFNDHGQCRECFAWAGECSPENCELAALIKKAEGN